jgi:hypothetical protein
MRCVAISMLSASASSLLRVFRAMIWRCCTCCLHLCVLGISRVRSNFVVVHTNRDGAVSIRGSLLFSWPTICELFFDDAAVAAVSCYSLKLNSVALFVSHGMAVRCYGRRGRGCGTVVRKQTARVVEFHRSPVTCTRAALVPRLLSSEGALYALLSPSI